MRQYLILLSLIASSSAVMDQLYSWVGRARCALGECCDKPYINPDFTRMEEELKRHVFGQHIIHETVVSALRAHFREGSRRNRKPLVIAFNGRPGTGKNYVARFIAVNIYQHTPNKKGVNSSAFVHAINAIKEYPDNNKLDQYKEQLQKRLLAAIDACGRSLIIFDEAHKLPEKLLDSIKPFLDGSHVNSDFRDAIFIFLSNAGGDSISNITLANRDKGQVRKHLQLTDFEKFVSADIYNSKGGLSQSDLISSGLIDHFVPFLPLEREHVRECIRVYLDGCDPVAAKDDVLVEKILNELMFYPPEDPAFSVHGCRRVEQKADLALEQWTRRRTGRSRSNSKDEI